MCSRMILNLHETAHVERARGLRTTATGMPQFTTRFEPDLYGAVSQYGTVWDDDSTQRDSSEQPDPLFENAKPWMLNPEKYWEV